MLHINEDRKGDAPLYNIGRWYYVEIESESGTATITKADADLTGSTISGSYLKTVEGLHIVDYLIDITPDASSAVSVDKSIRLYADGIQGVTLPTASDYTKVVLNIFGYFE